MAVSGAKRKAHISPAKGGGKKTKSVAIDKQTLVFLKNLRKNNNKEWMQEHKSRFEAAKENFEEFTAAVLSRMQEVDELVNEVVAGHGEEEGAAIAREFVERINLKFPGSEDGPYNPFLCFHLLPQGLRHSRATYTLRVQPFGHTTLVAGLEKGDGPSLHALRTGLAEDASGLTTALEAEEIAEEFGESGTDLLEQHGEPLTRAPTGFDKENEHIELLKNRRFVIVKTFKDDEVLADSFIDEVVSAFTAAEPFVSEVNRLVAENEPEVSDDEEDEEEED